jgi:hypothetical protein
MRMRSPSTNGPRRGTRVGGEPLVLSLLISKGDGPLVCLCQGLTVIGESHPQLSDGIELAIGCQVQTGTARVNEHLYCHFISTMVLLPWGAVHLLHTVQANPLLVTSSTKRKCNFVSVAGGSTSSATPKCIQICSASARLKKDVLLVSRDGVSSLEFPEDTEVTLKGDHEVISIPTY